MTVPSSFRFLHYRIKRRYKRKLKVILIKEFPLLGVITFVDEYLAEIALKNGGQKKKYCIVFFVNK
jgi:hypothetical protein